MRTLLSLILLLVVVLFCVSAVERSPFPRQPVAEPEPSARMDRTKRQYYGGYPYGGYGYGGFPSYGGYGGYYGGFPSYYGSYYGR